MKRSCAQAVDFSDPQQLLDDLSTSLFGGGYGDKLFPSSIQVHPSFDGSISYQGLDYLTLRVTLEMTLVKLLLGQIILLYLKISP